MRKKLYESKLYAWRLEIKNEEKKLKEMEWVLYWKRDLKSDYHYFEDLENKVFEKRERIEWMKQIILVIEHKKIAPKARKSNNLQDLYSRTNNSYYD